MANRVESMSNPTHDIFVVQFLHSGKEHTPKSGRDWNTGLHRRKFVKARGKYAQASIPKKADLLFWTEWEAPSSLIDDFDEPDRDCPRYLYQPLLRKPPKGKKVQNTDPCVFGGFFYTCCMQRGRLLELPRGSVILFGSCVGNSFVLDTVFVVSAKKPIDHNSVNYRTQTEGKVPDGYYDLTLAPLYRSDSCSSSQDTRKQSRANRGFRLYFGASIDDPVEGMFSFFPCKPYVPGSRGFPRPTIKLSHLNPQLSENYKFIYEGSDLAHVNQIWTEVVSQIRDKGLSLGVSARMPHCG